MHTLGLCAVCVGLQQHRKAGQLQGIVAAPPYICPTDVVDPAWLPQASTTGRAVPKAAHNRHSPGTSCACLVGGPAVETAGRDKAVWVGRVRPLWLLSCC
jgi:hypothetical protein